MTPYYDLDAMLEMMDEPNRSICQRAVHDNRQLFQQAAGSSYNHQAWTGGYWDHITEVMNIWLLLFNSFESTGRLSQLEPEERFTQSDGLVVLFWHDIEKPWGFVLRDGRVVAGEHGRLQRMPQHMPDKAARKTFAEAKISEYGVVLSPALRNALDYVEGIRDSDYSPFDRRMRPLAVLCHASDMLSARAFYGFPLAADDAWGASRAAQ
jgi:hypothetical protein